MNLGTGIAALVLLASVSGCQSEPWVELGGERFRVEVADSLSEQARGLMYRRSLPEDRGMLFVFGREDWRSFHMMNTLIPLDIMFFDAEGRLLNVHTAQPCRTDPCQSYPSVAPARYVLELNAGKARELGLERGSRLEIHIGR